MNKFFDYFQQSQSLTQSLFFCRWIFAVYLLSLLRPIRLLWVNFSHPLPPWDPILLLSLLPEPPRIVFFTLLSGSILCSLFLIVSRRPRRELILVSGMSALATLGLLHSFKYMHHRDGLLAISIFIVCVFYQRNSDRTPFTSAAPVALICSLWSLLFLSAGFQKLLNYSLILNPKWLFDQTSQLSQAGWDLWALPYLELLYTEFPTLLIIVNLIIIIAELSHVLFFLTGAIWVGWIGAFLLFAFRIFLGIGFWEVLLLFPCWLFLREAHKARS